MNIFMSVNGVKRYLSLLALLSLCLPLYTVDAVVADSTPDNPSQDVTEENVITGSNENSAVQTRILNVEKTLGGILGTNDDTLSIVEAKGGRGGGGRGWRGYRGGGSYGGGGSAGLGNGSIFWIVFGAVLICVSLIGVFCCIRMRGCE